MQLKGALFGLIAAFALPAVASATDLYVPDDAYVAPAEPGFDWNGFCLGIYGSIIHLPQGLGFGDAGGGKLAGFNLLVGEQFLIGAEVRGGAYFDSGLSYTELAGVGRAGVVLGDRVLIYAVGGIGYDDYGGGAWLTESIMGGGAEFAFGDNVSVRGEITHRECIEQMLIACIAGGLNHLDAAVIWHFD